MKIPSLMLLAIPLVVTAYLARSDDSVTSSLVHVQGVVRGPLGDDFCPGAEITFTSEHVSKIVISDHAGFYQVDLPAGRYTMTVRYQILIGKTPAFMKQARPLFRASSTRLVLNVRMFAERWTCDISVVNKSGEPATNKQIEEDEKNFCGYEDQFAISDRDGTPYQLFIEYPRRSPKPRTYEYTGDQLATDAFTPVLVEYNLFTSTAEHLVYDPESHTISAIGNVEIVHQLGESQRAASMTFKITNGEAILVR